MQRFWGSNHHGAHNHADVNCVITVHHQNMEASVSLKTSFFYFEKLLLKWISRFLWKQPSMSYNHVDASCVMTSSNKEICIYLNGDCCCLFYKLSLTRISRFLRNQPCHQNKKIYVCLNAQCFCLFHKLLLMWISRFLWKQPCLTSMSQLSCWCFLRDDVIKTR